MVTEIDEQLLAAILEGDAGQGARQLADGADPNAREVVSGLTALMIAAGRGKADMVALLLRAGADVHAKDSRAGASALHKACQGGSLEVVRQLVKAGAFVDEIAVSTGHTALIEAIWFKHPGIVEYLLDQGAGLNISTHYGFTLLAHLDYLLKVNRIDTDKLARVAELVKIRQERDEAKVKAQSLMKAVVAGDLTAVERLIAAGVEIDERAPILNGFNDGHTPLLVACRDGHQAIAEALLRAGANVNATEPTFGAVPLHKATYNGNAGIVGLLARQPGVWLDFQGPSNGYTPLHDALWHGFEECSRILVEAGARLDQQGHDGKTPLDIAREAFGPEHELVDYLRAAVATRG